MELRGCHAEGSTTVKYGMAKRIGILGGISHESTAAYYTRLHHEYYGRTPTIPKS